MYIETTVQAGLLDPTPQVPPTGALPHRHARIHAVYGTHSARNITSWRTYLPEDCVLTMIKMGWDHTT
jgi:hypothetical protein